MDNAGVLELAEKLAAMGVKRARIEAGGLLELEFYERMLPQVQTTAGAADRPQPADPLQDSALFKGQEPPTYANLRRRSSRPGRDEIVELED